MCRAFGGSIPRAQPIKALSSYIESSSVESDDVRERTEVGHRGSRLSSVLAWRGIFLCKWRATLISARLRVSPRPNRSRAIAIVLKYDHSSLRTGGESRAPYVPRSVGMCDFARTQWIPLLPSTICVTLKSAAIEHSV
jgi:hypothetical protein